MNWFGIYQSLSNERMQISNLNSCQMPLDKINTKHISKHSFKVSLLVPPSPSSRPDALLFHSSWCSSFHHSLQLLRLCPLPYTLTWISFSTLVQALRTVFNPLLKDYFWRNPKWVMMLKDRNQHRRLSRDVPNKPGRTTISPLPSPNSLLLGSSALTVR